MRWSRRASLAGALSLTWMIVVAWTAAKSLDEQRYASLGFRFLPLVEIRNEVVAALPWLVLGVPAAVLVMWAARRPRALASLAATLLLLLVLAANAHRLNDALRGPVPARAIRLALMVFLALGAAGLGVCVGHLVGRIAVVRRVFEAGARLAVGMGLIARRVPGAVIAGDVRFAALAAILAAVALALPVIARPRPPGPLSVVIVLVDTMRADHLGVYGYSRETSPRIDAWAQGAIVFETAIAQASWTKPSVASLFTSLFPSVHATGSGTHVRRRVDGDRIVMTPAPDRSPMTTGYLPRELLTAAEVFQEAGYRTAGFVANTLVAREDGYGQGFDVYRTMDDNRITSAAQRWIEDHRGAPFLLYVHYLAPHAPYDPPSEHDRFARGNPSIDIYGSASKDSINFTRTRTLTGDDIAQLIDQYDGEIRYADAMFGGILDAIERAGLSRRTVVVLTSDHGEEFLEHGMVWHESFHLYRELTRIPLIVGSGDGTSGARVETPVMHIDLAPTLLEIVGLEIPEEMQGRSLAGAMRGGDLVRRAAFAETLDWGYLHAVRDDSLTLILNRESPGVELYDYRRDPGETENLGEGRPDERRALLDSLGAQERANQSRSGHLALPLSALTPEQREKLRSLGYVQ